MMEEMTSFSRHFMITEVQTTGRSPFRQETVFVFSTGMIVILLKCTKHKDRERLKISLKTSDGWLVQDLMICDGMPSGMATLHDLMCLNLLFKSTTVTGSVGLSNTNTTFSGVLEQNDCSSFFFFLSLSGREVGVFKSATGKVV